MHYIAERPDGSSARFETHDGTVVRASDGMQRLLGKGIDSALQMLAERHCIVRVGEYPGAKSEIISVTINPEEQIIRRGK